MTPGTVSITFLHPGEWSAMFAKSLMDLVALDSMGAQRIVSHRYGWIAKECHAARIHAGRNDIARSILDDTTSEWCLMLDADMGFAPTLVEDLLSVADPVERPIVGGLCFGHKNDGVGEFGANRYRIVPTLLSMAETDSEVGFMPMMDYPRNALVPVDATGAACLLIHRTVFEEIRDSFGDMWFSLMHVPKGEHGRTEFSEDISFCLRARAVGKQVYVHTGIRTTHDKGGVFLDEETYDAQRAARSKAAGRFADLIAATGGLMSPTELTELEFFAAHAPGPALEVGNYTGLTTCVISNALPAGTPFVTVDPHEWRNTEDAFFANVEKYGGEVVSITGPFETFLATYSGAPFGFVFYDGPHTPEHCDAFWTALEPHLAPDAIICWDDADWSTMARLEELVAPGRANLTREPLRRHAIGYSTGDEQVDLDLGKRHPDTYTLTVWGPK